MATVTAVVFKEGGKVYYFAPAKNAGYEKGAGVIVETSRGVEYATVVKPRAEVDDAQVVQPLRPVLRAATERDEETHRKNAEKRESAMQTVREMIERHGLDMKLIDCEFAFDGSKANFYYTAPQRVDFRELVKELSSYYHMRIELRQVGIRDEIKMIGGIAPCGRECCCSSCMPDVKKVSIKMAKNQGLSLNPQKISGLCGRLMCCLSYENDYYADASKQMPKIGATVTTPDGKGIAVNVNMLKMQVRVRIEDQSRDIVSYKDYSLDEIRFKRGFGGGDERSEYDDYADGYGEGFESEATAVTNAPRDKGDNRDKNAPRIKFGKKNNQGRKDAQNVGRTDGKGDERRNGGQSFKNDANGGRNGNGEDLSAQNNADGAERKNGFNKNRRRNKKKKHPTNQS